MTPRRAPDRYDGLTVSLVTRDAGTVEPVFEGEFGNLMFQLRGYVHPDHATFHVMGLTVDTDDFTRDVGPTALRELPLTEVIRRCKALMAEQSATFLPENLAEIYAANGWGEPSSDDPLGRQKRLRARIKAASREAPPQGAARGRGDAFYRRVALDLIELVESGKPTPGGVLETLAAIEAKRLKEDLVPVQTVRTWLRISRERGFLAPGERGRLVAVAGPKLYQATS